MKGLMEKSERGTLGFPFQMYTGSGNIGGRLITTAHYHNEIEIMKVQKGVTRLIVDGEVIAAKPDRLYFINPADIHSMYVDSPCRYRCIVFSKELLSLPENSVVFKRLINPLFNGDLRFCQTTDEEYCCRIFDEIDMLSQDGEKNATVIVAKLLILLGFCEERGFLEKTQTATTKAPIHRAIRYMEENFTDKLTLEEISKKAQMNPKYFCSYFKKHTGTTPITYLNELRIRKAKKMLNSGCSVLDSAYSCGFENVSFFIRKFKETTGITPGKYKKENSQQSK